MRREHLFHFYKMLLELKSQKGAYDLLDRSDGSMSFPEQGVYFFFELDEYIEDSNQLRVVRVGTHAVSLASKTTLWNRLAKHKGHTDKRGGNHRESVFRMLVGDALLRFNNYPEAISKTWGTKLDNEHVRMLEKNIEDDVSYYIGKMPFLCLNVPDKKNGRAARHFIEKNAIALLSNFKKERIHHHSNNWLGMRSSRPQVRESGLWNVRNVGLNYDPHFLHLMKKYL